MINIWKTFLTCKHCYLLKTLDIKELLRRFRTRIARKFASLLQNTSITLPMREYLKKHHEVLAQDAHLKDVNNFIRSKRIVYASSDSLIPYLRQIEICIHSRDRYCELFSSRSSLTRTSFGNCKYTHEIMNKMLVKEGCFFKFM